VYSTCGVFFTNFTLPVFREKVYQELGTAKYLHTLDIEERRTEAQEEKKGDEQGKMRTKLIKQTQMIVNNIIIKAIDVLFLCLLELYCTSKIFE
jgi:hypothetical protein